MFYNTTFINQLLCTAPCIPNHTLISAPLMKSLHRYVEKRITVDWFPEDDINRWRNAFGAEISVYYGMHGVVHKSWLIRMML